MTYRALKHTGGVRLTLLAIWITVLFWLPARALASVGLEFFFSPTCPHCQREAAFLDSLEQELPEFKVARYSVTNQENVELLESRLKELDALEYFGPVPITIIDNRVLVGFSESVGQDIRQTAIRLISAESPAPPAQPVREITDEPSATPAEPEQTAPEPNAPTNEQSAKPLPLLAVTLGFIDGFNVCSLGALILILSLVLTMRSRKRMALYGGLFILTTAVVYGALIFAWYGLFKLLAPYLSALGLIVGFIGVIGGLYFLKEFVRMRKYGVTCDAQGNPMIGKLSQMVQRAFDNRASVFVLLGTVLVFAAVVTAVEFPCSAAVPLMFAGALAQAHLTTAASVGLMALFLVFYLLDELIVFGIAVWKLSLWMTSPRFTLWSTLAAGLLLLTMGGYYAGSVLLAG